MKRRDFTAGALTSVVAVAASFFGGTAKGKEPKPKEPKPKKLKPKSKPQPVDGQILDEGWAIIHPARPDGDDNGLNGPLAGWVELNYFSLSADDVDEIVRVHREPGCFAVPVHVVSCGKPDPKDGSVIVKLDDGEQSAIVIWINLLLRSCDPSGYPRNNSPQPSLSYATSLNSIFRKLTGKDHASYVAYKDTLFDFKG